MLEVLKFQLKYSTFNFAQEKPTELCAKYTTQLNRDFVKNVMELSWNEYWKELEANVWVSVK